MSNIIDSIKLSGTTYQIQGTGGEGTVSALTETNPTLITAGYYTATTIDTIYIKVKDGSTTSFNITNALGCYTSDDKYLLIRVGTNGSGITSVDSSSAYTSTISDGIAKIEFVSPLTLKRVLSSFESFTPYYFPQTPYTSGSTSEVVEGAVYDSLRDLSLEVLDKDSIVTVNQELRGNNLYLNLQTDKHLYLFSTNLASPTINLKGKRLNTQFSSSTVSQSVLNIGTSNYCTVQDSGKTLDDLTLTFNPSYIGGSTSTVFSVYLRPSGGGSSVTLSFTYDISNNSITWNTTGWDTYLSVVDTLSTDYKLKIVANTGYKINYLYNSNCSIGGVDALNKDYYHVTLVTTTSNVHDGQEVIDDLYANKQDKLSAGTGINITDNIISATGGGGGSPTVEVTQAEYDALVTAGTVSADTYYIITDAQAGDLTNYYTKTETNTLLDTKLDVSAYTPTDLSNYYTKSETSGATQISTALNAKADTATTYTKTEVDNAITAATSTKQDTLVSGTNIKTINNESILGSGNIDIQGGGGVNVVQTTGTSTTDVMSQDAVTTQLSGYVTTNAEQIISATKTFVNTEKGIIFKQRQKGNKIGFSLRSSASTNNEVATFEFRPNTYTDSSSVSHPLLYLGHYRTIAIANNDIVQTMVGFRQYDQSNSAAYHYLMPLPAEAKTPFSLTTSFKNYFAPLGFKNGSTMIKTDNTGVVDLSSELGGLKLKKLTQAEYDALSPNYDSNTLYIVTDS